MGPAKKKAPVRMRKGGSPKKKGKGGGSETTVNELRRLAKQKGYKLVKT